MRKAIPIVLSSAISLYSSGCVSPNFERYRLSQEGIEQKIRESDFFAVGIEGLQPFSQDSVHQLMQRLYFESNRNMAYDASSGDWSRHMENIRTADKYAKKIFLIGYSAGAEEVWHIADRCCSEGIPIEILFYLDPTHKKSLFSPKRIVPNNVKKVVVITGEFSGILGGRGLDSRDVQDTRRTEIENHTLAGTGHMRLPREQGVYQIIRRKLGGFGRR